MANPNVSQPAAAAVELPIAFDALAVVVHSLPRVEGARP